MAESKASMKNERPWHQHSQQQLQQQQPQPPCNPLTTPTWLLHKAMAAACKAERVEDQMELLEKFGTIGTMGLGRAMELQAGAQAGAKQ